jgi:hypothetical protein
MGELVRVKRTSDGAEFTIDADAVEDGLTVLTKDAVDRFGTPLGPKPKIGPADFSGKTKAELVEEAEARNVGRADDDRIPTAGTKAELVAALAADDA